MARKNVDAHIFQTDGIEHAAGCLNDSRRGIAFGGLQRQPFYNDSAQAIQFDEVCKFPGIAKGAGSGYHRVLKLDRAKFYF